MTQGPASRPHPLLVGEARDPAMDDVHVLLDLVTGYQRAAVLTAASRIGVFDALDPVTPRDVDALAGELRLTGAATLAPLLDVLVAHGLVGRREDGYVRRGPIAEALRRDGDLGAVIEKEATFARLWNDLDRVVREDAPLLAPWRDRLRDEPARCRAFLDALDVLARRTGAPLDRLRELAPDRRVLDVGGGLGSFARLLAASGSTVTLVDLAPVTDWATEALAGLDGVTVVTADAVAEAACGVAPASHDAALLSHLLHDLDDDDAAAVLAHAVEAVEPGGHVVVSEFAGDAGPGDFGPLFDLMMRVETGSRARALIGFADLMEGAGLEDVRRAPFGEPLTVLVGRVPG
ncbi:MAG: hypothetical protein RLZZ272_1326 [Actinomycetota bacterium]